MKGMKYFQLIICWSLIIGQSHAQTENNIQSKAYAVIIGISQYQNTGIPSLNYAAKDATYFSNWLKSSAGGMVPDYQVKLLVNNDASIASIYHSFTWLTQVAKENDRVYIFFSGHGDMEIDSASISKGYLLAWNSPQNNYVNNAISVDDLNKLANKLSIYNKVKVILITDACHSGKLAGDFFKGKQLTAHNLQTVLNNEVRMASCAADELSAEGPGWGGGRGVFSFYLMQALNGMGNQENKDTITINDINQFLNASFATDKVLASEKHKQHPVIDGNPNFTVAVVDTISRKTYQTAIEQNNLINTNSPAGLQSLASLGPQPIDYFIQLLQNSDLESHINLEQCFNLPAQKIPTKIIENCLHFYQSISTTSDSLNKTKEQLNNNRLILYKKHYSETNGLPLAIGLQVDSIDKRLAVIEKKLDELIYWASRINTDTLNQLINQLKKNTFLVVRFNENFIQAIQQKAQDMINAYLIGDIAELEKRQYYYSGTRSYNSLLAPLQLAVSLAPKNDYLFQILNTQFYYIAGLTSRLQIAVSKNQDSLLTMAFKQQYHALNLQPYAAYIHNELGNLFMYKKRYDSAEYHFNIAAVLAPTWAIPWSNRIRLNLALNNLKKAKAAINIATSLQSNLSFVNVNAGLVMEKENNWLAAESYYQNAIAKNNVHYLPFERLAIVYLKTGEYAKADYFFYQAKKRKEQFAINDNSFSLGIELGGANPGKQFELEKITCSIDSNAWHNKELQPYTLLASALQHINNAKANTDEIISELNNAIKLKPGLPLAHHYLGKLWYQKQNWLQAKNALLQSIALSKNDSAFNLSILKPGSLISDSCLLAIFQNFSFHFIEDHYLLASTYEKLQLTDSAIHQYRIISTFENTWQIQQASFNNFSAPGNSMWGLHKQYHFKSIKVQFDKNIVQNSVILPIQLNKNYEYSFEIYSNTHPDYIYVSLSQNEWANNINLRHPLPKIIFYQCVNNKIIFSDDPGSSTLTVNLFETEKMEKRKNNIDDFLVYQYETPINMGGAIKAARLLEGRGNYVQAEQILLNQVYLNRLAADIRQQKFINGIYGPEQWTPFNFYWLTINRALESETYNFYNRMMNLFPRDFLWKEKAGLFLYKRLALTYHQMPIDEQPSFYEKSKEYAYPFMAADDLPEQPDIVFELSGSAETIRIPMAVYNPVQNASNYLQQSIQLSGDAHAQKKVLEPLAELNSWMGEVQTANTYYTALLRLQPGDANFRNKFIAYLLHNNQLTAAKNQLDSLYDRKQLNRRQLLLLAQFHLLNNPMTNLSVFFKNFVPTSSDEKNTLYILYAKQQLMQGKIHKALNWLQDSIKYILIKPVSEFAKFNTNTNPGIFRLYAMASMNAVLQHDDKALAILKQALEAGFNYKYVLDADNAWDRFRNTTKWKMLLNNYSVYIDYENMNLFSDDYKAPVSYRFPKAGIQ